MTCVALASRRHKLLKVISADKSFLKSKVASLQECAAAPKSKSDAWLKAQLKAHQKQDRTKAEKISQKIYGNACNAAVAKAYANPLSVHFLCGDLDGAPELPVLEQANPEHLMPQVPS